VFQNIFQGNSHRSNKRKLYCLLFTLSLIVLKSGLEQFASYILLEIHMKKIVRSIPSIIVLLTLCPTAVIHLNANPLFEDNFESGLDNWTTDGSWVLTTAHPYSASHAVTDSAGSFYTNNTDASLTLTQPLNCASLTSPALRFYQRHALELNYDWASVEISTDNGISWTVLANYTGTQAEWRRQQIELTAYANESDLRLRFRLITDASVIMDGWYLDDVLIGEKPNAPALTNVTTMGASTVSLSWSPSTSETISKYLIYRSQNPGSAWHDAQFIGETHAAATSFIDITAAPKTRFYYRVVALDANELHTESNEISVMLPAGTDYPFIDNTEAAGTFWIADGGWERSAERAASATTAWSDSPDALYTNNLNAALRLAMPMDLSNAAEPSLTFVYMCDILNGDAGLVEVSINNGSDWTTLKTYSATTATNSWIREQLSLAPYIGESSVLIRFRLTTSAADRADGWWLDDIAVAETPSPVSSLLLDNVTSHSIRLSWPQNNDLLFSHYAIHRVTDSSGVSYQSSCISTVSDQTQTQWTDSGLALNTVYAYRVYTVSPYGTHSADGAESTIITLNNPLPFADGFENGDLNWNFLGAWAITTETNANGNACLTDSPLGFYPHSLNSDNNYALTAVDLTEATWPVLRFKDRFDLQDSTSGDRGILDVSPNGSSWTRVYGVSSDRSAWTEQIIDLSRWRGQSNLRIRFYIESNNTLAGDGWYIDDISVEEHAPSAAQTLPFTENFEEGLTNWIAGGWIASTNTPYEGALCARDLPVKWTPSSTESWLSLNRELDLSTAVNPQITLWARGWRGHNNYGRLYVQISKDGGINWLDISGILDITELWGRFQYEVPVDYRVDGLRLAVKSYTYYYDLDSKFFLDMVGIGDEPPGAPLPFTPANNATVTVLRPTLAVTNAIDLQSDLLTYSFEVYTNAALDAGALVAQNPAIAEGQDTTSWQLDVDLPDGAQVWWRCRATDSGENIGAWSETATFFVELFNESPTAPLLLAPSAGATLPDADAYLIWQASLDPDGGDAVSIYRIQIADSVDFTNLLVNTEIGAQPMMLAQQLGTLDPSGNLSINARYYWRVQAVDSWGASSEWSSSDFIYGALQSEPEPDPPVFTKILISAGRIRLEWEANGHSVSLEQTPCLSNPQWTPVQGAVNLTTGCFEIELSAEQPVSFYRAIIGETEL
jgi:hypothetical protein